MERIDRALRAEIAAGRLPGAVIRVVQDGVTRHAAALGLGDPADRRAMAADSLFRIYSMTKPFVSVAALILMEEGRLQLADPVAAALPAFAADVAATAIAYYSGGATERPFCERPRTPTQNIAALAPPHCPRTALPLPSPLHPSRAATRPPSLSCGGE